MYECSEVVFSGYILACHSTLVAHFSLKWHLRLEAPQLEVANLLRPSTLLQFLLLSLDLNLHEDDDHPFERHHFELDHPKRLL